jgi:hydrogenase maturation factor
MNRGSISQLILKRSVLKHIRRNRKEVTAGAAVGQDFAVLNGQAIAHGLASGELPQDALGMTVGEMALLRAMNQLAVSGARPVAIHVVMLVPATQEEAVIRKEMERLNQLADRQSIQILGGHTEVSNSLQALTVSITIYGSFPDGTARPKCISAEKLRPGDRIVMVGQTGMLGVSLLAAGCRNELKARFAESYIQSGIYDNADFSIAKAAGIAWEQNGKYVHDVSFGGIYGGLAQLAEKAKLGILVHHEAIPIRQETIEISGFFNINPYLLLGTGAALIVCSETDSASMVQAMRENGFVCGEIGTLTQQMEKVVESEALNMRRHITPPDGDEIYKIF